MREVGQDRQGCIVIRAVGVDFRNHQDGCAAQCRFG